MTVGRSGSTGSRCSAASANDIWAVGQVDKATFTEHFNGTTWSVVPRANPIAAPVDFQQPARRDRLPR
jgi:hypothetical protein